MQEVTFETKCWENDYKLMLKTDHLKRMIKNCNYPFVRSQLIINNVNDRIKVNNLASRLKNKGIINDVINSTELSNRVLDFFNIEYDSFNGGYWYSIAELCGIYSCRTKYLLHFSSDSYIPSEYKDVEWIYSAIDVMERNPQYIVANPTWNYRWEGAEKESFDLIENKFFVSCGFSDQCYLINTEAFRKPVYGYDHPDAEMYPQYGGNHFERRVFCFMKMNNKLRLTAKDITYVSKNITHKQYIYEKYRLSKI